MTQLRRRLNLNILSLQIHRSYQSCQSPHPSDVAVDSETSLHPVESRDRRYAQLHLPLTAVLEPSNSFLQSISDEVPVNGKNVCNNFWLWYILTHLDYLPQDKFFKLSLTLLKRKNKKFCSFYSRLRNAFVGRGIKEFPGGSTLLKGKQPFVLLTWCIELSFAHKIITSWLPQFCDVLSVTTWFPLNQWRGGGSGCCS